MMMLELSHHSSSLLQGEITIIRYQPKALNRMNYNITTGLVGVVE